MQYAFAYTTVTSVALPNSIVVIRSSAFYGCTTLAMADSPRYWLTFDSGRPVQFITNQSAQVVAAAGREYRTLDRFDQCQQSFRRQTAGGKPILSLAPVTLDSLRNSL